MKRLSILYWVAMGLTLALPFVHEPNHQLWLAAAAAFLVAMLWFSREVTLDAILRELEGVHHDELTTAYEKGRKFGAINAEDVQEEIALARQRNRVG